MKNHEHYLNWTIELSQYNDGCSYIWISTEYLNPYDGYKFIRAYPLGEFQKVETGISKAKEIIDEIIQSQNNIILMVINSHSNRSNPPSTPSSEDISSIPF